MNLQELTDLGVKLGYEGSALQQFVREQQEAERKEREAKRESERQEREDRQKELEIQLQIEQAKTENGGAVGHSIHMKSPLPKLPKFEEGKDDMDSFLERFERFANCQVWPKESWAISLSPLLAGKGLQVYATLSVKAANDYDQLKIALLKRYELNEEGFRRRFKESRPEAGETVSQFVSKLQIYFTRWVEMAEVEKDYGGLKDLMLRDQFLSMCHEELATFLKERMPELETIEKMAHVAEQYVDAHSCTVTNKHKRDNGSGHTKSNGSKPRSSNGSKPHEGKGSKKDIECFLCHKMGHYAKECKSGKPKQKAAASQGYQKGKGIDDGPSKGKTENKDGQDADVGKSAAAACQSAQRFQALQECMENGRLKLSNGESVPVVSGACDQHSKLPNDHNMPVSKGLINGKVVKVLRDTGCSSAAVRASLVKAEQMTGEAHMCILIDGTIRRFPLAKVSVDTPFYVGEVEVMVMKKPICDFVLGNLPGVKDPSKLPLEENPPETVVEKAQAVMTRAQAKAVDKPLSPLIVQPPPKAQAVNVQELQKAQKEDQALEKLWELANEGKQFTTRGHCGYHYEVKKEVLYRVFSEPRGDSAVDIRQIVVPFKYRKQVLSLAHESIVGGHLGSKKTLDRISTSFYWPGISSDVTRFCRSCDMCQRMIPKGKVTKVPLGRMPIIDTPFQRIAVDLVGPLAPISGRGNRYILTVVDYATRYPEAVALAKIDTETVAEALLEVFCRVGFPKEILSDRGTQFTSDLMKEVSRLVRIKQLFTTPYNPKCNGLCERVNGVLKSMLRKMCQERPRDWDRYLPAVLFAYREVPQASTGFSPFEMLYGRTVRGPMQILKDLWTESETPETRNTYEYVLDLRNRLEETCELARENLLEAQGKYKHHYDKGARERKFEVGHKVLVLLPTDHNKLLLKWKGPFEVTEVVNACDYKVKVKERNKVYHANLLKQYSERDDEGMEVAAVAIIEPELEDDGVVDDENLLELRPMAGKETYVDVHVNPDLTQEQKAEVKNMVKEFSDIFTDQPGTTDLAQHTITTTIKEPIRVRQYPIPYAKQQVVEEEVRSMLKAGVIEASNSPYNSPIVLVKKKDGSNRFCIDFRRINAVTKFDCEPMTDVDSIMAKVGGDKYFTKVDMTKGYWQIPVEESSRPLTAFSTSLGSFQFRKMPFGLVNSAATYNRMMRKVLQPVKQCDNFVDDILGHTERWHEHMMMLRELFTSIRKAGLTARPTKTYVGYQELDFVGHTIGAGKVAMDPEKLDRIRDAPRPHTKKQVRSFLGLAGYYRRFIPNFADRAVPLTDLTKKGQPNTVRWGEAQDRAFAQLRDLLTQAPILRLPNLSERFLVQTDASDTGVGAVLLQEQEDGVFPVAYASKKLLPRETRYSVIERECLAIVFAVKRFQRYLYGKEFTLQTDHQPLSYIQRCRVENSRVMRWALFLQNYRFRIEAIRGTQNVGADYLSRLE